jgi:hypothetical protein
VLALLTYFCGRKWEAGWLAAPRATLLTTLLCASRLELAAFLFYR